jgi:hypothetical protein
MAQWTVHEIIECDARNPQVEKRYFRVASADDPAVWVAQTNAALGHEAQRELALLIAEGLSALLGI